MADDTTAAMDHLRESCAIAAGKAPVPTMTDMFTGEARQVTCWQNGEATRCLLCGNWIPIATDGRAEWASCPDCGVTRDIP